MPRAQPSARRQHPRGGRGGTVKSVAVIGASLAGLSAARALRAQGFDGELTDRRRRDAAALRPSAAVEGVSGRRRRRGRPRAGSRRRGPATPNWLLGVHATELDTAAGAVVLDDGTHDPCRWRRHRHRRAGARSGPAAEAPGRCARAAHHRRRDRPARRAAPGRAAGGHRRRVHRRRGRVDRNANWAWT